MRCQIAYYFLFSRGLMNWFCCEFLQIMTISTYWISSATSWRSFSVLVLRPCRFLLTEYN
jgi:hypothetical protein